MPFTRDTDFVKERDALEKLMDEQWFEIQALKAELARAYRNLEGANRMLLLQRETQEAARLKINHLEWKVRELETPPPPPSPPSRCKAGGLRHLHFIQLSSLTPNQIFQRVEAETAGLNATDAEERFYLNAALDSVEPPDDLTMPTGRVTRPRPPLTSRAREHYAKLKAKRLHSPGN